MIKQAMTAVAMAALSAMPVVVGAQAATSPPTKAPLTCDCPLGDPRGDLRNLAAFAPLGLLGVMAAAGGTPAIFGSKPGDTGPAQTGPAQNVASGTVPTKSTDPEVAIKEGARNTQPEAPANPLPGGMRDDPANSSRRIPDPVSPDSLRGGLRAPNTGTPLPSVFLLGTGLIAIGCVTVLRTRS